MSHRRGESKVDQRSTGSTTDDDDEGVVSGDGDGQFSDDGGGIFHDDDSDGGSSFPGSDDEDDDGDGAAAQQRAKRAEKISVKAWLVRKQHYTPLIDLLPRLIKFLSGDFDPLDDEEDHGVPLWRRFMDSCDEGEAQRFVGSCMAAVQLLIARRYESMGYTQASAAGAANRKQKGGEEGGGGRKAKASVKKGVRDSNWPTDLAARFSSFLCNKNTEFVFENVPVKPSFYEQYSKYGKRSFEKLSEDQLKEGELDDPNRPTHMKSRVVFAYGVAQKGKAPKPLKPDEVLTNRLFKRQCQVLWRELMQRTEEKVHKMVNRVLQKRAQDPDEGGGSDDEDAVSDEEYAPNKHAVGMNVESTLTEKAVTAGEKLRRKVGAKELERLECSMLQQLGLRLLQRWLETAREEERRHAAAKEEEEAIERRRTATLMIRKKKLAQIAVPKELLHKIQAGAAQHKPRRFDFSQGKTKLNRAKHHQAARNSLQMATQLVHGQHKGFIHSFANVSDAQFGPGGDVYECRRVLLRLGYVHRANFTDEDGVFDKAKYEEAKEFAARHKQRSDDLRAAIYDKSDAKVFVQKQPLVARALKCLEALKAPQLGDREAKDIWRSVGKLLKGIDRTSLLEPWIQWSCRDGFGLERGGEGAGGRGGSEFGSTAMGRSPGAGAAAGPATTGSARGRGGRKGASNKESAASLAEQAKDASMRRFRFICSTYWTSFRPIGCDIHNNLDSKYRYNLMKIIRKSGIDFPEMFAYGYRKEFQRKSKLKDALGSDEELVEDPDFEDDPEKMEEDIDEGRAWLSSRAFIRTLRDSGVPVPPAVRHQLLHCLDPNRDGRVTMDEFVRFIKDKAMKTVRCVWDEICPVCGMRPAFRTLFHKDKRTGRLICDEHGTAKAFKTELDQHKQMRRQKAWRQAHEKRRLPPPEPPVAEDGDKDEGRGSDDYDVYADDMTEVSGGGGKRKKKVPFLPKCPKKCQAKDWSLRDAERALGKLEELSAVDLETMRVKTVLAEIKVPAAPQVWQDVRPYQRWQLRFQRETTRGDQSSVRRLFADFTRLTTKLWVCYAPSTPDDFVEFFTVEVFYGGDWFLLKTDPECAGGGGGGGGGGGDSGDDATDDDGGNGGVDEYGSDDDEVAAGDGDDGDGYDDDFGSSGGSFGSDSHSQQRQVRRRRRRRRRQRRHASVHDEPVRQFCWDSLPTGSALSAVQSAPVSPEAASGAERPRRNGARRLTANTTYKLRVRAYNMHGASPFTQVFCTTAPDRPLPPKFNGCTASAITYNWADKSTLEIQALRALFQRLDRDANGLISRAELLEGIRSSSTLEEFLGEVKLSARATRKLLSLEAQAEREQEGKTRGGGGGGARNPSSVLELLRASADENSDPISWPFFKSLLGGAVGTGPDTKASAAQSFDTQTRYRLDKCTGSDASTGRQTWVSCHGEGEGSSTVNSQFTVKGLAHGSRQMFRLVVINRAGVESPPSDVVIGCTKLKAPDAPRVPEGNSVSHSAVRLMLPKMSVIGADSAAARAHSNQQRILKWQSTQADTTAQEKLQVVHGIDLGFIFERYDEDGSGSISPAELRSMLKDLGAPADPESVERAVVELDQDNSGDISFDEFITWWLSSDTPRYIVLMSKGVPQSASLRDMGGRVGVFDTHMTGAFKPSARVQEAAAAASPQHKRQLSTGSSAESLAQLMGKGWVEVYRGANASPIIKGLIPNTAYQFKLQLASPSCVSLLSPPLEMHTAPERVMDPGPVLIGVGPRWIKLKWYAEASGAARWQIEGKTAGARAGGAARRGSGCASGHAAGTARKLNTTAGRRGSRGEAASAGTGATAGWSVIAETRGVDSTALVHLKNMAGSNSRLLVRVVGLNSLGVRSAPSAVREVDMALAHSDEQAEATPQNAEAIFDIDCTGDVVVGDTILFTEKIFIDQVQRRGIRRPEAKVAGGGGAGSATTVRQFAGSRTLAAIVLGEDWVLQDRAGGGSGRGGGGGTAAGGGTAKLLLRSTKASRKQRVSRTLVLHVLWCTVQQRELAKSHGIAPAKRIKRSEASLYQFDTLRRAWVDEDLRVDLRSEFCLRRDSETAFQEKLRRHQRQAARPLATHSRAGSRGVVGEGKQRDFEEWQVSMDD